MKGPFARTAWIGIGNILILVLGTLPGCGSPRAKGGNFLSKLQPTVPATETSRVWPSSTPQFTPDPGEDAGEKGPQEMINITVVFDNYPHQTGLRNNWGFAAVVEIEDQTLLFDTGASSSILLKNMAALGIDPEEIEIVVLSHEHDDHVGGLQGLLRAGADPVIYIPPSFSAAFKTQYQDQARLIESQPGLQIGERLHTIGELSGPPPEQALVIDTTRGLVVITGCAHPGVDRIILEAKRQYKEDIYLVLGGFHLGSASASRVEAIIKEFKRLGVQFAAPCHCTGDDAIGMFRDAFGDGFIPIGVGSVVELDL